jgi:hypothetical protein
LLKHRNAALAIDGVENSEQIQIEPGQPHACPPKSFITGITRVRELQDKLLWIFDEGQLERRFSARMPSSPAQAGARPSNAST